jgi:hypothetical protein
MNQPKAEKVTSEGTAWAWPPPSLTSVSRQLRHAKICNAGSTPSRGTTRKSPIVLPHKGHNMLAMSGIVHPSETPRQDFLLSQQQ